MHTGIMRDDEDLYKFFSHKIVEDNLFGNSEGSDVKRWQGAEIQAIIKIFMERLKVETAESLFRELDKNSDIKRDFIIAMKVVKKIQKQRFIDELFEGTFGELDVSREELEKDGIDLLNRPFFTFVRRMVPYKCSNMIVDMLEDKTYRERIIRSRAVIVIGGRKFDDFAASQHRRIQKLIKQDPRLYSSIIFISNHNAATSWVIQQGTDNGGMLSFEGMEAGPTSPGNAGLNWATAFSVIDGVMAERTISIRRDENGKVVAGTGYVVAYGEERVDNLQKSRLPSKKSIMTEIEESSKNYFQGEDHDAVAFNNMWLNMTQGDIITQGSGLIRNIAKAVEKKKQKEQAWDRAVEKFVASQSEKAILNLLYAEDNEAHDFYFGEKWPIKKMIGGLDEFVQALKFNTEKGYIYKEAIDIIDYINTVLKNKRNSRFILEIINGTNGSSKHYSPLTYYEKQKELVAFLEKLVLRLKQGNDSLDIWQDIVCQEQDLPQDIYVKMSI